MKAFVIICIVLSFALVIAADKVVKRNDGIIAELKEQTRVTLATTAQLKLEAAQYKLETQKLRTQLAEVKCPEAVRPNLGHSWKERALYCEYYINEMGSILKGERHARQAV
ncbi:hypothetical protein UFOVP276_228 [uncultured Caudovirales phage]|uniref:Uncharacterized protein n=1 Tax=uncultured Caudovirales phage TaxID=2100421 RepID=A0A6J5LEF4_9CAUD|nr:hypothetical protein UFOVP127_122 [uncultured Caudovirales phage]CAB4135272.1 hypothetical protein UFOVP276_228 [uncultured Caudovirales phage]